MSSSPPHSAALAHSRAHNESSKDSRETYPNVYLLPPPSPPSRRKHLSRSLQAALEKPEQSLDTPPPARGVSASVPGRSLSLRPSATSAAGDDVVITASKQSPRSALKKPLRTSILRSPLTALSSQRGTHQTPPELSGPTVPFTSLLLNGGTAAPPVQRGSTPPQVEANLEALPCRLSYKRALEPDSDFFSQQPERKQASPASRRAPSTFGLHGARSSAQTASARTPSRGIDLASNTPSRCSSRPSGVKDDGGRTEQRPQKGSTHSPLRARSQPRTPVQYQPHASGILQVVQDTNLYKPLTFASSPSAASPLSKPARLLLDLDGDSSGTWRTVDTGCETLRAPRPVLGCAQLPEQAHSNETPVERTCRPESRRLVESDGPLAQQVDGRVPDSTLARVRRWR